MIVDKIRWAKGTITGNNGKPIDCWRSDCKLYLFYLNVNRGADEKKGELDKAGHRWWWEVFSVPATVKNADLTPSDETRIGITPKKSVARLLAADEKEDNAHG